MGLRVADRDHKCLCGKLVKPVALLAHVLNCRFFRHLSNTLLHHPINVAIQRSADQIGIVPQHEPPSRGVLFTQTQRRGHPPKVTATQPRVDACLLNMPGKSIDYDVTVRHPLATRSQNPSLNIRRLEMIASGPTSHLNTAQSEKAAKHKEICSIYGHDYRTIALSLYGAWGSDSGRVLSALDAIAMSTLPDDYTAPGMWSHRLRKTVSRMLYRGIAQVFTIAMAQILHKGRPHRPEAWFARRRPQSRTAIDTAAILPTPSFSLGGAL